MANIVYIDDEQDLTDIFQLFFQSSGHNVAVFNNEFDAIQFCNESRPEIVFVDYRLENLRGDQVAEKLPKNTKVVLVTGELKVDVNYQFDSIINKPFMLNELEKTVERLSS